MHFTGIRTSKCICNSPPINNALITLSPYVPSVRSQTTVTDRTAEPVTIKQERLEEDGPGECGAPNELRMNGERDKPRFYIRNGKSYIFLSRQL